MNEVLDIPLQEKLLSILLFNTEQAKILVNILPADVWSGNLGISLLIKSVYNYITTYGEAPGDTTELLIDQLNAKPAIVNALKKVLENAYTASFAETIPTKYLFDKVEEFNRFSTWRQAIELAHERLAGGSVEEIETIINNASKKRFQTFQRGSSLVDVLNKLLENDPSEDMRNKINLGIPALDIRGVVPSRKEMMLFVAPLGTGKSWWLIYAAKQALIENKKVLHITLEMSEELVGIRYLQALYGYSRRDMEKEYRLVLRDNDFDRVEYLKPGSLDNEDSLLKLVSTLESDRYINKNLIIKEFPTKTLTITQLRGYLDSLELQDGFIPDVIVVDYADLMKNKNPENLRVELGLIYGELRGIAVERNLILLTASQSSKEGAKNGIIDSTHIAESWEKGAIADYIITYSQKEMESMLGLARLNVAKARNAEDKFEVLITQNYTTGQFCLSSTLHNVDWKNKLEQTLGSIK